MIVLYSKIENNDFKFINEREKKLYLEENKNYKGLLAHSITKTTRERTSPQNRALHLWCDQVAKALNESGQTLQEVLDKTMELEWSGELVKDLMWRKVQIALLKKKSTTKLEKVGEIEVIYEHLNRFLAEKCNGIHVPFPSEQNKNE